LLLTGSSGRPRPTITPDAFEHRIVAVPGCQRL